jgi:anti-sigma B factor antagonist
MTGMDWGREQDDDVIVLHAPPVLIAANRLELKDRVSHEVEHGGRRFLIDFSETRYIDSSGLGLLVMLTKHVGKFGGELRLAHLNEDLRTLLALSKLDTILYVLGDDDEGDGVRKP